MEVSVVKKFAVLCLILSSILCGCEPRVEEPKEDYEYAVYEARFSAVLIENGSVGDDWSIAYRCGDISIQNGYRWTVPIGNKETVKIDITVTEQDKRSDVGSGTLSITLADGFKESTDMIVTENGGRYKGNAARWRITCTVSQIE